MIGQTLSHYRILGSLGAGAMGVVYLAEDERLGRQVALKLLPADSAKDQEALDRFRLEARTASALSHPGICTVYDIGVYDDMPFIVMELLKGETLRERVSRGPLKIGDVLEIGIQLADALEAAHAQGIMHRDIKPENIWVGEKLRVKILDFGLAKLTRERPPLSTGAADMAAAATGSTVADGRVPLRNQLTTPGMAIGTVSYMSPEQARGEDVDARTDIFALGAVLYEMITGRQAFGGSTWAIVFDAILNSAPVSPVLLNPETPPRLVDAIDTALEKDRDLRYQDAASLEADLKRIRRDRESGAVASVATVETAAAAAETVAVPPPGSSQTNAVAVPAAPARSWLLPTVAVAVIVAGGFWMLGNPGAGGPAGGVAAETERAQSRLDARESMAADDQAAAARALAAAQALAPGDAQVTELAARLSSPPPATPAASPMTPVPAVAQPAQTAETDERRGPARQVPSRPKADSTPAPDTRSAFAPAAASAAPTSPSAPVRPAVTAGSSEPLAPSTTGTVAAAPSMLDPPPLNPPARRDVEPSPPPAMTPAAPARESDEVLVRRALTTYERAIEGKDVALFRSVLPDISEDEIRRLRASFAQIERQEIAIKVEQLTITGDAAEARVARVDTVHSGGRPQASRSTQTIRLARRAGGWIIVELGR